MEIFAFQSHGRNLDKTTFRQRRELFIRLCSLLPVGYSWRDRTGVAVAHHVRLTRPAADYCCDVFERLHIFVAGAGFSSIARHLYQNGH